MNTRFFDAVRGAILVGGFAGVLGSQAFVPDINDAGQMQRWKLTNPDTGVHTNVVNRNTKAVRYFIASDAYSATNTTAEYNAVRASFGQWQAVPGTTLKFEDAGYVPPGMDIEPFDHTNIVYWVKNTTFVNGGMDNISGHLGVCYTGFFDDNTLVGADVVLNAAENTWYTDFSAANPNALLVESVLTHELGHFIGLSHSPVGGATMLYHGDTGASAQAGLSSDEICAVRALYPLPAMLSQLGSVKGRVTKNGSGVLGAVVVVEDTNGNVLAGTVSRGDGGYELPCLPPGNCQVRVTPLDPYVGERLIAGGDINYQGFAGADLDFLPSTNTALTVQAGITNTLSLSVVAGTPAFRITYLREPTADPRAYTISSVPISLIPGQSNLTIGVFSSSLPASGINLRVFGTGITLGAITFQPTIFTGLVGISVVVNVASNAVPGMRSLAVTRPADNAVAYANGFVDIQPLAPDFNFDGLDDRFQRQYFPLFTSTNAAPAADPDGDGLNNLAEYYAGTVPTNATSVLKIDRITQTKAGTTVRWRGVTGKRYQVLAREQVAASLWQTAGSAITANQGQVEYLDVGATNAIKFYRVQVVP